MAGRRRRAVGWTLLILGVMVVGVWVASGWSPRGGRLSSGRSVVIEFGTLHFRPDWALADVDWLTEQRLASSMRMRERLVSSWRTDRMLNGAQFEWANWSWNGKTGERLPAFTFPLWPIPLLLWARAALLLRSGVLVRRRALSGACAKCGYPLAGLAQNAPCPECGRHETKAATA